MTQDKTAIVKGAAEPSGLETLRRIINLDHDDVLAIAKTGVRDGPRGLAARGISVIQHWNERRFGAALLEELEEMRQAGRIRENFHETDAGTSTFREFLKMIASEPDERRFNAFCALFMDANSLTADEYDLMVDLDLMEVLRELSPGEMLLLSGFLKLRTFRIGNQNVVQLLAKEVGIKSEAFIHKNIPALLESKLVSEGTWRNQGGSVGDIKPLLTDFGEALLERVKKYEEFKSSKKPQGA